MPGSRQVNVNVGIETSPQAGGVVAGKPEMVGSLGSPSSISAGTSIAHNMNSTDDEAWVFVVGNGGAIDLSSNPQIAVPTRIGQKLAIIGTSDTNTVKIEHGNGVVQNGEIILGEKQIIRYMALSLTEWTESGRQ